MPRPASDAGADASASWRSDAVPGPPGTVTADSFRKGPVMRHRRMAMRLVLPVLCAAVFGCCATSAFAYNPITPFDAGKTVMLDGKHLTIAQVVSVARYGAKVQLTAAARQRSLNAYYLLLE